MKNKNRWYSKTKLIIRPIFTPSFFIKIWTWLLIQFYLLCWVIKFDHSGNGGFTVTLI